MKYLIAWIGIIPIAICVHENNGWKLMATFLSLSFFGASQMICGFILGLENEDKK